MYSIHNFIPLIALGLLLVTKLKADDSFEVADKELNKIYKELIGTLGNQPITKNSLREAQRSWLTYMEKHIDTVYPVRPGERHEAIYGVNYFGEVESIKIGFINRRIAELTELLPSDHKALSVSSAHLKDNSNKEVIEVETKGDLVKVIRNNPEVKSFIIKDETGASRNVVMIEDHSEFAEVFSKYPEGTTIIARTDIPPERFKLAPFIQLKKSDDLVALDEAGTISAQMKYLSKFMIKDGEYFKMQVEYTGGSCTYLEFKGELAIESDKVSEVDNMNYGLLSQYTILMPNISRGNYTREKDLGFSIKEKESEFIWSDWSDDGRYHLIIREYEGQKTRFTIDLYKKFEDGWAEYNPRLISDFTEFPADQKK